jgi:hypothetical protein
MSTPAKLVQYLGDLQRPEYGTDQASRLTHQRVARALDCVWHVGRRGSVSSGERDEIRRWAAGAILPIQIHVERLGCEFRTHLDSATLRKRSALQFLIDDFGFHRELRGTAELLDEIIKNITEDGYSDSDGPQPETDTTGVPSSHHWWRLAN